MKYYITLVVDGRAVIEVDADNIDNAVDKAKTEFHDFDIGDLECINAYPANVEDENGKLTDIT